MRRARIICTLGPASGSPQVIERLVLAGMDVARLNMSHGTHGDHRKYIRAVRAAGRKLGRPVAVLLDLQGIKIRIGEVKGEQVLLQKGSRVLLRAGDRLSTAEALYISSSSLARDLKKGHRVLLDDGLMELIVTGRQGGALVAKVKEGGFLSSRKGVNLPDSHVSARSFTAKDQKDLAFGLREDVDAVAISFVTSEFDILALKNRLEQAQSTIPVIAKIEKPAALDRIEAILDASDGIMVARGDLGVELSAAAVPVTQKDLIRRANRKQKLVITATQMLESMRQNPVPTRAEAADVANAILDGSDAVMLSGETSVGRHPVRVVRTMARLVEETERTGHSFSAILPVPEPVFGTDMDRTSFAVADAAVGAAADVGARCIVVLTKTGYTASLIAKFRPTVPIIACTSDRKVIRRMKLLWGVTPQYIRPLSGTDALIREVERVLITHGYAKRGQDVVLTASIPLGIDGKTNFLKVHRVGGN